MKQSKLLAFLIAIVMLVPVLPKGIAFSAEYKEETDKKIKLGVEVLLENPEYKQIIEGKNVGLVTNPVGVDQEMNHLIDILHNDPDVNLVALFAPEHGIRGDLQAGAHVANGVDPETGIPVYSLYGGTARPTPKMLEDIDVLLYDLQEVGTRYYTYIYLMADCMYACMLNDVKFVVLDRPNPLGGLVVEGPMMEPESASGVGRLPIPLRYGMTLGELAMMFKDECNHWWANSSGTGSISTPPADWDAGVSLADVDLTVIPMEGWSRDMYYDDTGLPFVMPSPNLPTFEACLAYGGTGWIEGLGTGRDKIYQASEGRGTTKPFELIGAPFVEEPSKFAKKLNELEISGVRFRAASFTPLGSANKSSGQRCHGVEVHIYDKHAYSPVDIGLALFLTLQSMYPEDLEASWRAVDGNGNGHFDLLLGNKWMQEEIRAFSGGATTEEIKNKMSEMKDKMEPELDAFLDMREKYLISGYSNSSLPEKPEKSGIKLGVEVLLEDYKDLIQGKNVALVTNPVGVDQEMNHLVDTLYADPDVNLVALFGPEHGVRGDLQAGASVPGETDAETGIPVYSLYGSMSRPTKEIIEKHDIEVILYDLQEVGTRYYTYIYLMADCMLSCIENDVKFIVLDRPNPLGGLKVEGPVLQMDKTSGVGRFPIPLRYGMTLGELAMLFKGEYNHYQGTSLADIDLTVIPMKGWDRDMYYDDTGLQFVMPSPNMPSFETALVYGGTGWIEGLGTGKPVDYQVSEGRGTTKPFQLIGASFIKPTEFAKALNSLELPGVRFRAASFTPWAGSGQKSNGKLCHGVEVYVYDKHAYSPVDIGLGIYLTMQSMYPEDLSKSWRDNNFLDLLVGNEWMREEIKNFPENSSPSEIKDKIEEMKTELEPELDEFMALRQKYLIYPEQDYILEATEKTPSNNSIVTDTNFEAPLIIKFNRDVKANKGNITIYNAYDDSKFQTIDITSNLVDIDGNAISISHDRFDYGSRYYVIVDRTAIMEADSIIPVYYTSGDKKTSWMFKTISLSEEVTFTAIQTGGTSGTADSTGIELSFSQPVTGLTADNIIITNGTGSVTKGALSGSGNSYRIALASVISEGSITVKVSDFGNFIVKTAPQTVSIYKNTNKGSGGTPSGGFGSPSSGSSKNSSASESTWIVNADKTLNTPTSATQIITGNPDKNGIFSMTITKNMVEEGIAETKKKWAGQELYGISLAFESNSSDTKSLSGTIEGSALDCLVSQNIEALTIQCAGFRYTLDKKALKELDAKSVGNVVITATPSKISGIAQAAIGARPVYDIILKDSQNTVIESLGNGAVTQGIKYSAASWENNDNLSIIKVENEKLQWINNTKYDNGWLIWSNNNNSIYGVGYRASDSFTDTVNHWGKGNIDFVVNHGLISGITATAFEPDTNITRGDFLMALGKLSGTDIAIYKTSSFTDISSTNRAMPYIEWAAKNGIVHGIGNNEFGPNLQITREQMAVMMQNYTKATQHNLLISRQYNAFEDDIKISSWAKDAVKTIQQAGIINGKDNNLFDPQGNATRAEASTILCKFIELVIE